MLTIVAHEGCTNRFAEGALFALVLHNFVNLRRHDEIVL